MEQKYVKEVNQIKTMNTKVNKLVELFRNKRMTIDDLLTQEELGLKAQPETIYRFATKLEEGRDGLEADVLGAGKLYLYVANKSHGQACRRVGLGYLQGHGFKKDLKNAGRWLKEAKKHQQDNQDFDYLFLLAGAYLREGKKVEANRYFRRAIREEGAKDTVDVKNTLSMTLDSVYKRVLPIQPVDNLVALLLQNRESGNPDDVSDDDLQDLNIEKVSDTLDAYVPIAKIPDVTKAARKKEFERQVQTEKHYFSPERTTKPETKSFAKKMQSNRLMSNAQQNQVEELDVTHQPARRLITAEISVIEASVRLFGRNPYSWYDTELVWPVAHEEVYEGSKIKQGNEEKIKIDEGSFAYRQRVNPHCNHLGDYEMQDLGTYVTIFNVIKEIQDEKALAGYMLRYSRTGTPITRAELLGIRPGATDQNVVEFNRIFYHCFVKEVARWRLSQEFDHELPLAVAQIRAVKLIESGFLKMKDVFSKDSKYGVFTGKDIGSSISAVKQKISRINRVYTEVFLKGNAGVPADNFSFYIEFFKSHGKSEFLTTREELHKELKEGYGSGSDTDGEGYDSDTAKDLYPSGYSRF